jgi:hypothetical protein
MTITTTILAKQEIDLETDLEIHAILSLFLTHRSDVRAFRYERQRIGIHYIPGATRGYLVGDEDSHAVIDRFCDMGLIELDWSPVYTVLGGQDEPVVWIKEPGLIFLIEKEAKRREHSKPIDLDGLPF